MHFKLYQVWIVGLAQYGLCAVFYGRFFKPFFKSSTELISYWRLNAMLTKICTKFRQSHDYTETFIYTPVRYLYLKVNSKNNINSFDFISSLSSFNSAILRKLYSREVRINLSMKIALPLNSQQKKLDSRLASLGFRRKVCVKIWEFGYNLEKETFLKAKTSPCHVSFTSNKNRGEPNRRKTCHRFMI